MKKSGVHGLLGIRTLGHRMEEVDEYSYGRNSEKV